MAGVALMLRPLSRFFLRERVDGAVHAPAARMNCDRRVRAARASRAVVECHDALRALSFLCHPERRLLAHAKDLVAPPNEVAPSIRTMSDATNRAIAHSDAESDTRLLGAAEILQLRCRSLQNDKGNALRSPQSDKRRVAWRSTTAREARSALVYQLRRLKKEANRGASARTALDRKRSRVSRMRRAAQPEAEPVRSPEPPQRELGLRKIGRRPPRGASVWLQST